MNRDICDKCSKPIELCDCPTGTTYDLICRQHEAILKLREALVVLSDGDIYLPPITRHIVFKALKDTEGL